MNSTTRANSETDTGVDFDAIIRDVVALRQDFADLMSQLNSECSRPQTAPPRTS